MANPLDLVINSALTALVTGFFQKVGDKLGDLIFKKRLNNVRSVLAAARKQVGKSVRGSTAILLPVARILEECQHVDDRTLQRLWASLLAATMRKESPHPAFVQVLKELSPFEARLLVAAVRRVEATSGEPAPWKNKCHANLKALADEMRKAGKTKETDSEFLAAPENLRRLGLVRAGEGIVGNLRDPGVEYVFLVPTEFAYRFVKACSPLRTARRTRARRDRPRRGKRGLETPGRRSGPSFVRSVNLAAINFDAMPVAHLLRAFQTRFARLHAPLGGGGGLMGTFGQTSVPWGSRRNLERKEHLDDRPDANGGRAENGRRPADQPGGHGPRIRPRHHPRR